MGLLIELRGLALAVATLVAFPPATVLRAQQTIEPEVKATFLYNFTRFIEWPGIVPSPAPGAAAGPPFRVCAVADPKMEQAIRGAVEGESIHGRPLIMMRPQRSDEAALCQILFVGRSEERRAAGLLAAVRDLPVLTVGDSSDFVEQGGTIEFVLVNNRVRFDVNLASAQRAHLKVSANLLRVARTVEPIR